MSQDSKSNGSDANSDKGSISEEFNSKNLLAQQIASLPQAARDQCRMIQDLGTERLEAEKRSQQRSHAHRVTKVQNDLLIKYVRDASERPPEIRADPTQDLRTIEEQSERIVRDREAFFLRNIEREAESNLRLLIANARQGHDIGRGRNTHDQEHEH